MFILREFVFCCVVFWMIGTLILCVVSVFGIGRFVIRKFVGIIH